MYACIWFSVFQPTELAKHKDLSTVEVAKIDKSGDWRELIAPLYTELVKHKDLSTVEEAFDEIHIQKESLVQQKPSHSVGIQPPCTSPSSEADDVHGDHRGGEAQGDH